MCLYSHDQKSITPYAYALELQRSYNKPSVLSLQCRVCKCYSKQPIEGYVHFIKLPSIRIQTIIGLIDKAL